MRALVLGLARSGRAAVGALRHGGHDVVAHDAKETVEVTGIDAGIVLGPWDDGLLRGVDLVVKSPGVPEEAAPVRAARAAGVEVISEIELGVRMLDNRFVGITGTNGKTTTTALLGAMFDAAGVAAEVVGNIGRPLTELVGTVDPAAWVVCELSSFQLEGVTSLRPRVALLTNLEPDHLDRHGTFDAYAAAKLRLFALQTGDDTAVVPVGFRDLPGEALRVEFTGDDVLPAEPLIPGAHNRENAAAATAAARAAGLSDEAIAHALRTFPGVEHRIEEVAVLGDVRYVNDSKATNVAAALRALASFPGARLHVILGGRGKHESYAPLAGALSSADRAYVIGEAADEIAAALRERGVPYESCGTLASAVGAAAGAAAAGDVVLLSPACASFDQFTSFEHRGEEFRRLVQNLAGVSRTQLEQRILVLVTLGLVAFGLVMVFSATSASAALGQGDPMRFLVKQGIYAVAGIVALVLMSRFDYHRLRAVAPILLVGAFAACVAVLVAGPAINGAHRWFIVGPVSLQPSELAKIAVCIWVCAVLARRPAPRTMNELMKPIGIVVALFGGLIVIQPDLGTTISLFVMVAGILLVSGMPLRLFALATTLAVALGGVAIWMEPYRRERLFSFLDPWQDPEGSGFQTVQAMIGIGSGGITGEGLGQGIQKINFLPEAHTDMIFAVVGEELGLVGSFLVIAAFAAFTWAGFRIALACADPFGKRLAAGVTTLVAGQAAINLAAVLGIAPLTGIPLPFVSYGGSSLLVLLAAVGVLLNIAVNERVVEARVRDRGRGNGRSRQARPRGRGGAARTRSDRDVRRDGRPRRVAAGA